MQTQKGEMFIKILTAANDYEAKAEVDLLTVNDILDRLPGLPTASLMVRKKTCRRTGSLHFRISWKSASRKTTNLMRAARAVVVEFIISLHHSNSLTRPIISHVKVQIPVHERHYQFVTYHLYLLMQMLQRYGVNVALAMQQKENDCSNEERGF